MKTGKPVSVYAYYTCSDCKTQIRVEQERIQSTGMTLHTLKCPVCSNLITPDKISRKTEYLKLYEDGKTLNEIAQALKVNTSSVCRQLIRLYNEATISDIQKLIPQPEYKDQIVNEIKKLPSNAILTKTLKQNLPEACDYDTIALVVAQYKKEHFIS